MPINLNITPYYDDYDADKGFHKILFVPGRPLQSRELTQLQSILQEQVKRGADFIFKNGSVVIPGGVNYRNNIAYLKLESNYQGLYADSLLSELVGKIVKLKVNTTLFNVAAQVIHVAVSENNDPPTLFIQYTSADSVTDITGLFVENRTIFKSGDIIQVEGESSMVFKVASGTDYTGNAALATISEGVFYVNGYYVQCLDQTTVLSKYTTTPTVRIGLRVDEFIVTEIDDNSLYDAAAGFSNHSAPGAHRLKIDLVLSSLPLLSEVNDPVIGDDAEVKFIDLVHIKYGEIVYNINKTRLSEIENIIAERTFDESGNYVVSDFKHQIREYRSNNRGPLFSGRAYLELDIVSYTYPGNHPDYPDRRIFMMANSSGVAGTIAPAVIGGTHYDGGVTWSIVTRIAYNNGITVSRNGTLEEELADEALLALELSSGKAYVQGYQVELPGKTYVKIQKPRTVKYFTDSVIKSNIGSYVLVKNIVGIPNIEEIENVSIKNGATTVGSCYIRSFEYNGTVAGEATYKLYVFGVQMADGRTFKLDAISLSNTAADFTCDVVPVTTVINGTVWNSGTGTTLNGRATIFNAQLVAGQKIVISGISYTVASITSDILLTTVETLPSIPTASSLGISKNEYQIYGNKALIVELPHPYIRSTRSSDDITINHSYAIKRRFTATSSTGVCTITLNNPNEFFTESDVTTILAAKATSPYTKYTPAYVTKSIDSKTLTIGFTGEGSSTNLTAAPVSVEFMVTVLKTGVATKEKQKILKSKTVTVDTLTAIKGIKYYLGEADIYRVTSVKVSGGEVFDPTTPNAVVAYDPSGEVNVSHLYVLNTGQTPTEFGEGWVSLALKTTSALSARPIKIEFEYFDHTDGDYFSVNSYINWPYKNIPIFRDEDGKTYKMRDCLDFRARRSDDGTGFTGAGSSVPEPFASTVQLSLDYSVYLPRIDTVYINSDRKFEVVEGIPSNTPQYPVNKLSANNHLALFDIVYSPYTISTDRTYVTVESRKNVRYTMDNIGEIDDRLTKLEYYTSLSLLEKATNDLTIKDSLGLDRFKNGMIVDEFKDHGIGDLLSNDYICGVDQKKRELGCAYVSLPVSLIESNSGSRGTNNYTVAGSHVMLPYTEVPAIQQRKGSLGVSVNPFVEYTFQGNLVLYPNNDIWVNQYTVPSQVITMGDKNASSIATLAARCGILGTHYGAWGVYSQSSSTNSSTSNYTSSSNSSHAYGYRTDTYSDTYLNTVTSVNTTVNTTEARQITTTTADKASTNVGNINAISGIDMTPYMRTKRIVATCTGIKPYSNVNIFMNGADVSGFAMPMTRFIISSGDASTLVTYLNGGVVNDNRNYRLWGGFINSQGEYFNPWNVRSAFNTSIIENLNDEIASNPADFFDRGEALRFTVGASTGRLGVAVAVENESINGVSETVLYVANDLTHSNWATYGDITILGLTSGTSVVATYLGKTNYHTANSLGNYYCVLEVPNRNGVQIRSGVAEVMFSEVGARTGTKATYTASGIDAGQQQTSFNSVELELNDEISQEFNSYSNTTSTSSSSTSFVGSTLTGSYDNTPAPVPPPLVGTPAPAAVLPPAPAEPVYSWGDGGTAGDGDSSSACSTDGTCAAPAADAADAGAGCFIGSTNILMWDGKFKTIDSIRVGDYVVDALTGGRNEVIGVKKILEPAGGILFSPEMGTDPFITEEHPWYNSKGELCAISSMAYQLAPWLGEMKIVEPAKKVILEKDTEVFNLMLKTGHSHFANGISVDNITRSGGLYVLVYKGLITQQEFDEYKINNTEFLSFDSKLKTSIYKLVYLQTHYVLHHDNILSKYLSWQLARSVRKPAQYIAVHSWWHKSKIRKFLFGD